jgi:hypothetical protein
MSPINYARLTRHAIAILGVFALVFVLGGCNIKEKHDGQNKKVDIQTPFGDMKVNTNADVRDTGLPVYPGARPKPGDEHNSNGANVNLNTSLFGLKVVAMTYLSDDSPDKVLSYYGGEMKRYGDVITCKGGSVDHVQVKTKSGEDSDALTCDKNDNGSETVELKVGAKSKQRVVAVKPSGKGSEFSLVYVQTRKDEGSL